MSTSRMHPDEVPTNITLVRAMLMTQFPRWAKLPIVPVASAGTDNALYRLGDDLVVRLPRIHWAVEQVSKEQSWLPVLAPYLPLDIPVPVAQGRPQCGYPWDWSIYRWLDGQTATDEHIDDPRPDAADLGRFVAALQRVDAAGGPPPGTHNAGRGVSLAERDARTREAIASLKGLLDEDALIEAWEAALAAPVWQRAPMWIHGDLQAGNLLARDGRLCAVIDFGCLGVGDPACDVMAAWLYCTAATRAAFRAELSLDEATWARGRGWALSVGLIALPYYQHTNPVLAAIARRTIDQVLVDR